MTKAWRRSGESGRRWKKLSRLGAGASRVGPLPVRGRKAGEIFYYCEARGLTLLPLRSDPGWRTNEYVFERA